MCDHYTPCPCLLPKREAHKRLTLLLLDCWQREYDQRPYLNFRFNRLAFERRMGRRFHAERDTAIILQFLKARTLHSLQLSGFTLLGINQSALYEFTASLCQLSRIELRLMQLPTALFVLLQQNADCMKVNELILTGTPLTDADTQALRLFLLNSRTLRSLNVAACSLNHSRFAVLADGVHKSQTVRAINCSRLSEVKLTLDTTKIAHILSSLIWQSKLMEITMQHCELQAQDMEIIAEYLYRCDSKLLKLDFAYNIIASDGANYLFRAIMQSNTLKHLNIAGNGLGPHGGDVIAKYLSACYRLEYLNIGYNGLSAEAVNSILTSMKKPIPLRQLHLYGNTYNSRTAYILRRLLVARVVPQDTIDLTVTFDAPLHEPRVIPCPIERNVRAKNSSKDLETCKLR